LQAIPYFKARDLEINRALVTCMIRYEVKIRLLNAGLDVIEEPSDNLVDFDLSVEQLANNGLAGSFAGYSFKILKADDGRLPVPGHSRRKQDFYAQQLPLLELAAEASFRPNVVILWGFDPAYAIVQLRLAVPKAGAFSRASVQEHYNVSIMHPATRIVAERERYETEPIVEPDITIKAEEPAKDNSQETDRPQ